MEYGENDFCLFSEPDQDGEILCRFEVAKKGGKFLKPDEKNINPPIYPRSGRQPSILSRLPR